MKAARCLAFSALVLGAPLIATQEIHPDQSHPGPALNDLVAQLRADDVSVRNQASGAILRQRRALVYELQRTILQWHKQPEKRGAVALAMRLLGELRAEEAVPTLIEAIEFDKDRLGGDARPYSVNPQLRALFEIGLPSLDPLIKKVAQSGEPVVVERAALVIYGILGKDFARLYVEDRIHRQKEEMQRERLVRLKDQIERVAQRRGGSTRPLQPAPTVPTQKDSAHPNRE